MPPLRRTPPSSDITVITAAYNAEKYLADCIASVQNQSSPPALHIIIDDASQDASLAIAHRYAQNPSNRVPLRIIARASNGNAAVARNDGVLAAETPFFAVLDADDVALPQWLEITGQAIRLSASIGAVGGGAIKCSALGAPLLISCPDESLRTATQKAREGDSPFFHPGTVFRRTSVIDCGLYDKTMTPSEDLHLYHRLAQDSALVSLPTPLIKYRVHSDSLSFTQRCRQTTTARLLKQALKVPAPGGTSQALANARRPRDLTQTYAPHKHGKQDYLFGAFHAAAGDRGKARWHFIRAVLNGYQPVKALTHIACTFVPNLTYLLAKSRLQGHEQIWPLAFLPRLAPFQAASAYRSPLPQISKPFLPTQPNTIHMRKS